jgi:hypothetical protein
MLQVRTAIVNGTFDEDHRDICRHVIVCLDRGCRHKWGGLPFLPGAWAREAGGFPIMTLPVGFLMQDLLFLVASFYLLKQDLMRAREELAAR